MEELVAEMGAAFLCADLGITSETRTGHAAYIAAWLKVLKQDKRAIFAAAAHAGRAAAHRQSYQALNPEPETEAEALDKLSQETDTSTYVQGSLF